MCRKKLYIKEISWNVKAHKCDLLIVIGWKVIADVMLISSDWLNCKITESHAQFWPSAVSKKVGYTILIGFNLKTTMAIQRSDCRNLKVLTVQPVLIGLNVLVLNLVNVMHTLIGGILIVFTSMQQNSLCRVGFSLCNILYMNDNY